MLQAARRAAFFAASILFCFLIWIPDNVDASREYKTTSLFLTKPPWSHTRTHPDNIYTQQFFLDDYEKYTHKKRKIKHHISTNIIPDPWQIKMTTQKKENKKLNEERKRMIHIHTKICKEKNWINKQKKNPWNFPFNILATQIHVRKYTILLLLLLLLLRSIYLLH